MKKNIALIAHDARKVNLLSWAIRNKKILENHSLYATMTTGGLIEKELGMKITKFNSGPLGGDLQIGAKIAAGEIDCLIFFYDPLAIHPHESDVKALQRIATLKDIPAIYNESTGNILVASPFLNASCLECKNVIQLRTKKVSNG